MNCTNCGATATPACLARGACTFCGAAIQRADVVQAAPAPSIQHGFDEILQAMGQGKMNAQPVLTSIVMNGQTYRSVDEMPPDLRAIFQEATRQALGKVGSNVVIENATVQVKEVSVTPLLSASTTVEFERPARRTGRVGIFIVLALLIALVAGGAIILAR